MEKTKKTTVKKVLSIVGNTVLWLFVAFAIVITVIVFAANNKSGDNSLPSIGGLAFVTIKTDSMDKSPSPADYAEGGRLYKKSGFKAGSLIFVNTLTDLEKSQLEVGDVITFSHDLDGDGNAELNTHRIKEKYAYDDVTYFVTMGDHNPVADGVFNPINKTNDYDAMPNGYVLKSAEVLGKWNGHKIGGVGRALEFLQTRTGFFVVIILPLIAFFLFELVRFVMVVISLKGDKSKVDMEAEIRQRVMEELIRAQQQENASAAPAETYRPESPAADEPKTDDGEENKE